VLVSPIPDNPPTLSCGLLLHLTPVRRPVYLGWSYHEFKLPLAYLSVSHQGTQNYSPR